MIAWRGRGTRARAVNTSWPLRYVIAEAVEDPSLEVFYRTSGDPAEWVDDRGRPVVLPDASRTRATTEIRSGGVPIAALVHDPALAEAQIGRASCRERV